MRPRFQSDLVLADQQEPWDGPVVRLAELSDSQRQALYARAGLARSAGRRSEHLTWMCVNPSCRQWTMHGAHKRGRCNFCNTPRAAS